MKTTKNFNIFLRDNKSKLSNCYPFLSKSQILSKLRDQWKKLKNSLQHSSMKQKRHHINTQHAQRQLSNSQSKVSRVKKTTKVRKNCLLFHPEVGRHLTGRCIYDFVDSGYESSIFWDDEPEIDSPYLFAKDALDVLNNGSGFNQSGYGIGAHSNQATDVCKDRGHTRFTSNPVPEVHHSKSECNANGILKSQKAK
ncbi:hypothetical protein PoB_003807700 [Plakobranchus ocellatus]|uniref:Uncharacterized protein n=1 Tax=Plakobranchus ocellatus TaxID=259542 RepID=A0AAV4AWC4_9GAST|nr:hypothetical protein PoB_003807700 [Plakobranchus ocellatus]